MVICVTDRKLCSENFLETVKRACERAHMVILREKDLSEEEYFLLARKVSEICAKKGVRFCVNSFECVAAEIPGAMLQLSFSSFCRYASEGRKFCETGVSVHSLKEAKTAESLGADFLIAGHIFATACKKDLSPRGLTFLREIVTSVNIPVYAIGGINSINKDSVYQTGVAGVCMMSEMMCLKGK